MSLRRPNHLTASASTALLAVLAFACLTWLEVQAAPAPGPAAPMLQDTERALVERSNAFRALQGLGAVRSDAALQRSARELAHYMAQTDRYGHQADGRRPTERAQASGYAWCRLAENIGWQFHSEGFESEQLAKAFMQGWVESPPHRRNLLDAEATDMAVAVAHSPTSGRFYAVQMLGRPATRCG